MEKQRRVNELAAKILKHKILYSRGKPEISDIDFDKIYDVLKQLDHQHPALNLDDTEFDNYIVYKNYFGIFFVSKALSGIQFPINKEDALEIFGLLNDVFRDYIKKHKNFFDILNESDVISIT